MRFAHLAVLACAAAALAACQDTPTAQKEAAPRIYTAAQLAAKGITPPVTPAHVGQRPRAYVGCIEHIDEPPCEPQPRPMADFDYGSSAEPFYSASGWAIHQHAWSAAYSHIASMTLDANYWARNPGCNGPVVISVDDHLTATGSPNSLQGDRYTYSGTNWSAGVTAYHYFQASGLYTVDGYLNADTFESGASYCIP